MAVYYINMSDLYQIFLNEVRTFKDLNLSDTAIYAGILALSKVSYNPIDLFTAIKNTETELLSLQSPVELTSNIMYRISLGLLEDVKIMIDLLRSRDYENLNKLIFYSRSEEVKQDPYSHAPRPPVQRVNNIPSVPSQPPIPKSSISEPVPVRSSYQLSIDSFKRTQDGEPSNCRPASSKPNMHQPPADIYASYLNKPIPILRPSSPKFNINPFALDRPGAINSSVSSDIYRSTSVPLSHARPLPINNPILTCELCNQAISGERVNIPGCSHTFHQHCFINHIQLVYSDINTITCPALNCKQDIKSFISGYLPRNIKQPPVVKPPVSNPLSCPNCSNLVSNDGSPYLSCIQCNLTFCRQCRQESHVGMNCSQANLNHKRPAKQINSSRGPERFCQKCSAKLEILKPGELIRCAKCREGHCGDCYMSQFGACVCSRNKGIIGVRQT